MQTIKGTANLLDNGVADTLGLVGETSGLRIPHQSTRRREHIMKRFKSPGGTRVSFGSPSGRELLPHPLSRIRHCWLCRALRKPDAQHRAADNARRDRRGGPVLRLAALSWSAIGRARTFDRRGLSMPAQRISS